MDVASTNMVTDSGSPTSAAFTGKQGAPGGFPALMAMFERRDLGGADFAEQKENDAGSPGKEATTGTQDAGAKRKPHAEKKSAAAGAQSSLAASFLVTAPINQQMATPVKSLQPDASALGRDGAGANVWKPGVLLGEQSGKNSPAVGVQSTAAGSVLATLDEASATITSASQIESQQNVPSGQGAVPPANATEAATPDQGKQKEATATAATLEAAANGLTSASSGAARTANNAAAQPPAPAKAESGGPKEGTKTRQVSKYAPAVAVDPKVQSAVAAVVASTEARATESHVSHADVKLPAINPDAKQAKTSAKHETADRVSGNSSTGTTSGNHVTGDAEVRPAHGVDTAAENTAQAKLAVQGSPASTSVAVASVLAASSSNGNLSKANVGDTAPPAQSAPAPARASQDLPHVGTIVNSAALLEQAGRSEIKIGVRVGEFGNVEIRTQVDHQQVRAEISVGHQELGHALAAEMPALQQRLRDHDIAFTALNLTGQGASHPGDSRNNDRQNSGSGSQMAAISAIEALPVTTGIEQVDSSRGLDIRI